MSEIPIIITTIFMRTHSKTHPHTKIERIHMSILDLTTQSIIVYAYNKFLSDW